MLGAYVAGRFPVLRDNYPPVVKGNAMFKTLKKWGVAVLGALGLSFGVNAHAALDPNIATGLTALQTDFNSLMALVYPVAISITVALVIFGLVKMFIHRSAR